jgi:gamma-glutamyltranspeptidase
VNRSSQAAPAGALPDHSHTTHHFHVDRWGNFVAFTQPLGDAFGSALVVPGYGLPFNNGMKLYDPRPGANNSIASGKRPATSPSPTILLRNDRRSWRSAVPRRVLRSAR